MTKLSFLRAGASVMLGALLLTAAACGGDSPTGTTSCSSVTMQCVAGSYTLSTVNGRTLPAFIDDGFEQWTAMSMTLKSDGSVSGSISWKEFSNGKVVDSGIDSFTGRFSVASSSTLRLVLEDDDPRTATVGSDGSLTIVDPDFVLVLRK
jgi:hypothetical protein